MTTYVKYRTDLTEMSKYWKLYLKLKQCNEKNNLLKNVKPAYLHSLIRIG